MHFQVSANPKFRVCKNKFFTKAKGKRNIFIKCIQIEQILVKYSDRFFNALDFNVLIQEKRVKKRKTKIKVYLYFCLGVKKNS